MELFKHQKEALKILKNKKRFALFMEQGTGKTLVMIRRMEKLVKLKKVDRILIIAPSAVVPNWKSEMLRFLKDKDLVGTIIWEGDKKKRESYPNLLKKQEKPTVVIINYEKIRLDKTLLAKCNFDMLILDESQKVKNRTSQVTKAVNSLSKKAEYVYLLTGTPMGIGYEDIYGQFLIMNPELLGTRWANFEDTYLVKGGYMGKEIVGYKNLKSLKRIISKNSFRVKKSDCLNLPPTTIQNLYCELSPKARKIYRELDKEMVTEVEGQIINPTNTIKELKGKEELNHKELMILDTALVKAMKLQQITGGFVRNEDGVDILLDKSKLNLLKSTVESSSKGIIIFCKYRAEINTIKTFLSGYRITELSGKTKDKGAAVEEFQRGDTDLIIVQIKTGSAGINLTRASTAIFYSWSSSHVDLEQAKSRLDRIGQKNPVNIYFLVAKDTIDELSLEILNKRGELIKKVLR